MEKQELLERIPSYEMNILRSFVKNQEGAGFNYGRSYAPVLKLDHLLEDRFIKASSEGISEISLYGNPINLKSFPEEFGELKGLTKLELTNTPETNGVPYLPNQLSGFENLEYLKIGSGFENIMPAVSKMSKLKHLYLQDDGINKFPSEIENLKNLETLSLSSNLTGQFPEEINNLPKLKRLGICYWDFNKESFEKLDHLLDNGVSIANGHREYEGSKKLFHSQKKEIKNHMIASLKLLENYKHINQDKKENLKKIILQSITDFF